MRGKRPDEGDIRLLGVYARLFFQGECFKNGKGGALKLTSLVLDAHESRLAWNPGGVSTTVSCTPGHHR